MAMGWNKICNPVLAKQSSLRNFRSALFNRKTLNHPLIARVNEESVFLTGTQDLAGMPLLTEGGIVKKDLVARTLGYVMAIGAMVVYTPLLIKIFKQGNSYGFSTTTWVFNVIGLTLSIAYPMKMGFPFSTYMELVSAAVQSVAILGLLSSYNNVLLEYSMGIGILATLFIAFCRIKNLPQSYLNGIQIGACIAANYASIPQIFLTFRSGKATWSWISASMSLAGCVIRIFTTMRLTRDKLIILGYLIGVVTNIILLLQIIIFR